LNPPPPSGVQSSADPDSRMWFAGAGVHTPIGVTYLQRSINCGVLNGGPAPCLQNRNESVSHTLLVRPKTTLRVTGAFVTSGASAKPGLWYQGFQASSVVISGARVASVDDPLAPPALSLPAQIGTGGDRVHLAWTYGDTPVEGFEIEGRLPSGPWIVLQTVG